MGPSCCHESLAADSLAPVVGLGRKILESAHYSMVVGFQCNICKYIIGVVYLCIAVAFPRGGKVLCSVTAYSMTSSSCSIFLKRETFILGDVSTRSTGLFYG